MAASDVDSNVPQPFGAQTRRSSAPLYVFSVLFLMCLGFLVYLALFSTHQ